ncbi:unnamed protein product [Chrysodeixis includens]|uniref:Uncharacterized protein n=1 Tax=Chrysodeixis includens TaxID=689277 RepID=A0A9P0FYG7_CHRIL|nr:unnamed protein product [Chrysodeixis includens]
MASVTGLLVFAFAAAVSGQPLYCTLASKGLIQDIPIELEAVYLQVGVADWDIRIPDLPQCPHVVGVVAKVCDYDAKPEAYFVDLKKLYVHRLGNTRAYGTVKATVYCSPSPLSGSFLENQFGLSDQHSTQSQFSVPNQFGLLGQDQVQSKTLILKPAYNQQPL